MEEYFVVKSRTRKSFSFLFFENLKGCDILSKYNPKRTLRVMHSIRKKKLKLPIMVKSIIKLRSITIAFEGEYFFYTFSASFYFIYLLPNIKNTFIVN